MPFSNKIVLYLCNGMPWSTQNSQAICNDMDAILQLLSCVWLLATPHTAACQASLSLTISWSLLKLMPIESLINRLVLCHLLLFLPSIFPSIRVFSSELALRIRWPKYWSFSFNISPSSGYSGLISFRIDLFDLLSVQGTLKSLLQHHSSKTSILWCSAFFIVQLSHPYMTTGKAIAFVGKMMSLLFNTLSRFVIAFLPRSKHLSISWLRSPSEVILEPNEIKSVTVSTFSPLFAMNGWDQMPWSSFFECWVWSQFFHSRWKPSSRGSLVPLHFLP